MILRTLTFKELVRHFENSGTPEQKETMKLLFGALGGYNEDVVDSIERVLSLADQYGSIDELERQIRSLS